MNGKKIVALVFGLTFIIAAGVFSGLTIWANQPRGIKLEFNVK